MHEIVCVGDVHEGIPFDFRIDPETGISERAMDLHRNFARAAQWAIDRGSKVFIVLGVLAFFVCSLFGLMTFRR